MLKLMTCSLRPRTLRRRPRRMVDAARLADELRSEQDHANTQEKARRALDSQITELEGRLQDAKLEQRIRELEMELGSTQSRTSETYKCFQKSEPVLRSSSSSRMRTTRTRTG